MSSNIEQAIHNALTDALELTVPNVLVAYLRILGYALPSGASTPIPHEALVAFEHALDKEPAGALGRRMYTAEVARLRREYWKERIGVPAGGRCTCPACGKTVAYEKEEAEEEAQKAMRQKDGRRKLKGRRVVKRRREPTYRNPPIDPYGPSTSALAL
ncbi:hypothetical protein WOLCODRAFT_99053 [Wolfiporia cocos MD-104 SS10]|uniref:Uncharacterized protein n=1 Tax=Wolfiporia cocos (strain MD-104) TaxID=742152 RepID=A0A2H3JP24_WOLCO|nr:hypothetical protein WOLCODRAFT_99053 [Wolfiporia cocos MD-104 SS10]